MRSLLVAAAGVCALVWQQTATVPAPASSVDGPRGTHTENGLAGFAKILVPSQDLVFVRMGTCVARDRRGA